MLLQKSKRVYERFKLIYQAISKEAAEIELDNLLKKIKKKYPIVIQSWKNKWEIYLLILNILKILEGLFILQISLNLFIDSLETY